MFLVIFSVVFFHSGLLLASGSLLARCSCLCYLYLCTNPPLSPGDGIVVFARVYEPIYVYSERAFPYNSKIVRLETLLLSSGCVFLHAL